MLTKEEFDNLMERSESFALMALPGQPPMMHMGTVYLVSDLRRAVASLYEEQRRQSDADD